MTLPMTLHLSMSDCKQAILEFRHAFVLTISRSYLSVYTGLLVFATVMYAAFFTMFVFGQLRASRVLHNQLLESVLGTTLR